MNTKQGSKAKRHLPTSSPPDIIVYTYIKWNEYIISIPTMHESCAEVNPKRRKISDEKEDEQERSEESSSLNTTESMVIVSNKSMSTPDDSPSIHVI